MSGNYQVTIAIPAEKAREAAEAAKQAQVVSVTQLVVNVPLTGSCTSWMASAGITDPTDAAILIARESGCNPNAVNRWSGACGIGQQLPCGKWVHVWNDPIGGMIDMQAYVFGSYGSWANAVAHSNAYGWY